VETIKDLTSDSWGNEREIVDYDSLYKSIENKLSIKTLKTKKHIDINKYYCELLDIFSDMMINKAELNKERLFKWHCILFKNSVFVNNIGNWRQPKNDPMCIVSGSIGNYQIHYEAIEGSKAPYEMERFFHGLTLHLMKI
jgi:hypothetical protein